MRHSSSHSSSGSCGRCTCGCGCGCGRWVQVGWGGVAPGAWRCRVPARGGVGAPHGCSGGLLCRRAGCTGCTPPAHPPSVPRSAAAASALPGTRPPDHKAPLRPRTHARARARPHLAPVGLPLLAVGHLAQHGRRVHRHHRQQAAVAQAPVAVHELQGTRRGGAGGGWGGRGRRERMQRAGDVAAGYGEGAGPHPHMTEHEAAARHDPGAPPGSRQAGRPIGVSTCPGRPRLRGSHACAPAQPWWDVAPARPALPRSRLQHHGQAAAHAKAAEADPASRRRLRAQAGRRGGWCGRQGRVSKGARSAQKCGRHPCNTAWRTAPASTTHHPIPFSAATNQPTTQPTTNRPLGTP